MFSTILPLRAILFQLLFLFLAIAIEASILHWRLKLSRKRSVEYAASMNLLTTVLGWLIFFEVNLLLPPALKTQLISYIFFDQFYAGAWASGMATFLILTGLGTFFCTFFVELKGLELLELLLQRTKTTDPQDVAKTLRNRAKAPRGEANPEGRNWVITLLIANACSYGAILLILAARLIEPGYPL